jgi:hypothetical protein
MENGNLIGTILVTMFSFAKLLMEKPIFTLTHSESNNNLRMLLWKLISEISMPQNTSGYTWLTISNRKCLKPSSFKTMLKPELNLKLTILFLNTSEFTPPHHSWEKSPTQKSVFLMIQETVTWMISLA